MQQICGRQVDAHQSARFGLVDRLSEFQEVEGLPGASGPFHAGFLEMLYDPIMWRDPQPCLPAKIPGFLS